MRSKVYSLVVIAVCAATFGAGIAMIAAPRPVTPSPTAPFPGVVYDGNKLTCGQVAYDPGYHNAVTFYQCLPTS